MVSCSGSLVPSLCGEGGALQTNVSGVCGEHSPCSGHTGFAPLTGVCFPRLHCSGSRLLYMGAGPELRAVPVFVYSTKARIRLGLRFVPSPAGAAQAARSLRSTLSRVLCALPPPWFQPQFPPAPVGCVCLVTILGNWPLAMTPWWMSTIQNVKKSLVRNWEPVCSLVGDAISGAEFAPFPSPLPPASCLQRAWAGPPLASSSLELLSSSLVLRTGLQCVGAG